MCSPRKRATIQQVTTMLATSKNVLFPGYNHLLATGANDPSLTGTRAIIKVLVHQYRWLAGGYDQEIGIFRGGYHGGYLVDSVLCQVVGCGVWDQVSYLH